jgi:predicted MPP superfamily phosphohydrolase
VTSPTEQRTYVRQRPDRFAAVRARLDRVYVTGNHEYFSGTHGWLDYIDGIVIERNGDRLIIAGVDDATAHASAVDGRGANLEAALADSDPTLFTSRGTGFWGPPFRVSTSSEITLITLRRTV